MKHTLFLSLIVGLLCQNYVVVAQTAIIINEVYSAPKAGTSLPNAEYVELYNNSADAIDLESWTFSDPVSTGTLPVYIFPAGAYLILCDEDDTTLFKSYGPVLGLSKWPTLNNTGDVLTLKDNTEAVIDEVSYDRDWYNSSEKAAGGWALELIYPGNACGEVDNWAASEHENGGTPGQQNSIFNNQPDNTPPRLEEAFALSGTEVLARFDEKLDDNSPLFATYILDPSVAIETSILEPGAKAVKLNLSTSLQGGILYTLTVTNLTDCNGNLIGKNNIASFAIPESADSLDILINEILFNPRASGVDFVELYNNSSKYINLKEWQLGNAEDSKMITANDLMFAPATYLVLTTDALVLKEQYPLSKEDRFLLISSLPSYNNDMGTVTLLRNDGAVVDSFSYEETYHFELLDDSDGVSLERVSFAMSTDNPSNWKSAASTVGFATPGYVNSQALPAVETPEGKITISPKVIIPDGNGSEDFATINYHFVRPGYLATVKVMDMQGRTLATLAENDYLSYTGFYTWDGITASGTRARMGYYIVYFRIFDLEGHTHTFKETLVVGTRF